MMERESRIECLESLSKEIRRKTLTSLYHAQSGHPGPSLSWADIAATLFFDEMNLSGEEYQRDRFILSKGHGAATLYAAINILNPAYLPDHQLLTLRDAGSPLQGHPVRGTLPLIDASTGSLGQGLSVGIGYALGIKAKGQDRRVYVVLGDGELQEGQNWEAAMAAPKFGLENLTAIVDCNGFQNDGAVEDTMPIEPLDGKFRTFGWEVHVVNGHNVRDLLRVYEKVRASSKPSAIIAYTVKGKGVSFMEGDMTWHSKKMSEGEYRAAMEELE